MASDRSVLNVHDLQEHPDVDVAVGRIEREVYKYPYAAVDSNPYLGDETRTFGYSYNGPGTDGGLELHPRLLQGHVTMVGGPAIEGVMPRRSELSYPIPAGFSGAPVLVNRPEHPLLRERWSVLGMAQGNFESSIQVYKYEEQSGNEHRAESIHRVLEFGLFIDVEVLQSAYRDLGLSDVTTSTDPSNE